MFPTAHPHEVLLSSVRLAPPPFWVCPICLFPLLLELFHAFAYALKMLQCCNCTCWNLRCEVEGRCHDRIVVVCTCFISHAIVIVIVIIIIIIIIITVMCSSWRLILFSLLVPTRWRLAPIKTTTDDSFP